MCPTRPAARLTTAMPRITSCGTPISPSRAAMAPVKVSNGDFEYRYPLTIRLLK